MKKIIFIGLVIFLLVASVIPVMARNGQSNGSSDPRGAKSSADVNVSADSQKDQARGNQGKALGKQNKLNYDQGGYADQASDDAQLPFYLQGTITAIDPTAGTITVNLIHGNAQVKMYIGTELTMNASSDIQVFQVMQGDVYEGMRGYEFRGFDGDDDNWGSNSDEDLDDDEQETVSVGMVEYDDDGDMDDDDDNMDSNKTMISFDQLAVGQSVAIHGRIGNDTFTATKITVYIWMQGGEQDDD